MPGGLFFSTTVYSKVNSDNKHCFLLNYTTAAFSALTLMTGHQQEHPACKKLNDEVLVWLSDPSAARCRLFAYGSVDATAIPKPHHLLPHLNPHWFYLSGTGLPRLFWKRGR